MVNVVSAHLRAIAGCLVIRCLVMPCKFAFGGRKSFPRTDEPPV